MSRPPLRVAVVGAGPSGLYTAAALVEQDAVPVTVDVLDRLPTPFGLVRYGVAPDHIAIRNVRRTLEKILDDDGVRFVGNVEVGRDITVEQLRRHADATVLAYGAARDRQLGIPGEDLDGSIAALDLVSWYCGHPDADRDRMERALARATSAVVVGVGNVALDVARVLLRDPGELESTDMPQHVLDTLANSSIRDVHVVGRRSPARATFTSKELREFDKLADLGIAVDGADLKLDAVESRVAEADKAVARNLAILADWSRSSPAGRSRRLHLHFWRRPMQLVGTDRVEGIVVERTAPSPEGAPARTGELRMMPAGLVVRSVGHRSLPLPGLPFDGRRHVVPHDRGRVLRDGVPNLGVYVVGWLKRGPSGVIGTNRFDANETAAALLEDAPRLLGTPRPEADLELDLARTLAGAGVTTTGTDSWRRIDAAEIAMGQAHGRTRITMHDRAHLLAAGLPAAVRS